MADPREVARANNRINDPIIAGANALLSSPRVQGAGRIAQAVGEYALAASLTSTGLGTVGAIVVGVHATDTLNTGFQELVYGRPTDTYGAQAIRTYANSAGLQPEAEGLAFLYDALPTLLAPFAGPRAAIGYGQPQQPGNGSVPQTPVLATRELADEIANAGAPRSRQTVSLIETRQGPTIVSGGATDLTAAQKQLARQRGLLVADDLPGFHAEITGVYDAGRRDLLPTRGVTTNQVCRFGEGNCASQLSNLAGQGGFSFRLSPDGRSFEFLPPSGGQ